jgi:hypothetical protein
MGDIFQQQPTGGRDLPGFCGQIIFGDYRRWGLSEMVLGVCQTVYQGRAQGFDDCMGIGTYLVMATISQGVKALIADLWLNQMQAGIVF